MKAARTVFLKHGFEQTTVQMIADAADANIAAVNYHYGSKADLYAECIAAVSKSRAIISRARRASVFADSFPTERL